jgi:hypothetical protein
MMNEQTERHKPVWHIAMHKNPSKTSRNTSLTV